MPASLIPSFYIQNFARDISSSVTGLEAYRAGLVDENGDIIGPESSISPYEYFVIKLKKIFSQLPGGMTKASLASFLPALKMFTEEASWYGINEAELTMFIEGYISSNSDDNISYISLLEDMGSGGGAGAIGVPANGSGVNTGAVMGYDPVMGQMQRRKQNIPSFLDNCEMFDVCPEEYQIFKAAREWRHVPEGPTRNYLQRYQRRNPKGRMAVKNSETGAIHWLSLKPKMVTESRISGNFDVESHKANKDEVEQYARDNGIQQVEPSPEEIKGIVNKGIQKANSYTRASDVFEKQAQVDELVSSADEFEQLRSVDPDFAATVLGIQKNFIERSPSNTANKDMLQLARGSSKMVRPLFVDYKSSEWSPMERVPEGGFGDIIKQLGIDNPMSMFASATEHGGNKEFIEDRTKIDNARRLARQLMADPRAQEESMEMIRKKMAQGSLIVARSPQGRRIITPGSQIVPHMQYRQSQPSRRGGGERISMALGLGTGQRIADYNETLRQQEIERRAAEESGSEIPDFTPPRPFSSEPRVRSSPKIFKGGNFGVFDTWARDKGIMGEIQTPTPDDIESFSRSIGVQSSDDPIYKSLMSLYRR